MACWSNAVTNTSFDVDQAARHLEPGESGHLDVEEHEVGLQPVDGVDRFEPVAGLPDHVDAAELPQQVAEFLPRQLLIVDEDCPQFGHAEMRSDSVRLGISTLTVVPRPVRLDSFSVQAVP